MFVSGQNITKTPEKTGKKRFLKSGTPFAKETRVKHRISYKEVVLVAGIVVAVLAVITLWVKNPTDQSSSHATTILPKVKSMATLKGLVHFVTEIIF